MKWLILLLSVLLLPALACTHENAGLVSSDWIHVAGSSQTGQYYRLRGRALLHALHGKSGRPIEVEERQVKPDGTLEFHGVVTLLTMCRVDKGILSRIHSTAISPRKSAGWG